MKTSAGFSLVEVTIVIAVMIILSATLLGYKRSNERQIILFRDRAMFIGDINRAKTLAIEKFHQNPDSCAFGIYIHPVGGGAQREFIIFQDLKPITVAECRDNNGNYTYPGALAYDVGEDVQKFSLDRKLEFNIPSGLQVVFLPPDLVATSTLNNSPLPQTVVISTTDGSLSTTVTIGEGGQIITAQ
jgi:hypothetical protein